MSETRELALRPTTYVKQTPEQKVERARLRALRPDVASKLLADPQVVGVLTLLGGLYMAQRIPWAEDEGRNDMLRGVATTGVVLMALSRAGIGGWPAVAAAGVAGAATIETEKPLVSFQIPDWLKGLW